MTQTVEAVFESGVLKPLAPLKGLSEHALVTLTVTTESHPHSLAQWIGILPDEDAAELRRIVEEEFEKVDLSEWE